jgi:KDO2-lipid IV(A) lauroyltransferase
MSLSDVPARLLAGLMFALAWCIGRIPLGLLRALGSGAGRLAHALNTREAKVARRNLEIIAPELSASEREHQVSAILRATGRNALETLRIWTGSRTANLRLVRRVHGVKVFDAARAKAGSVIIAAPHFGNWELLIEYLAARAPFALVYRVPEKRAGDLFLRWARGGENVRLVPAETNAMRPLWKALKEGGVVGVTPDQQPKFGGGEFAAFFGKRALTLSLIPKLAERSGAPVIFAWAEPVPDGFDLYFEPALPGIADPDIAKATAVMNRQVEAIAARDPSQYQWTYKRYSQRPEDSGESNPYHPDCY